MNTFTVSDLVNYIFVFYLLISLLYLCNFIYKNENLFSRLDNEGIKKLLYLSFVRFPINLTIGIFKFINLILLKSLLYISITCFKIMLVIFTTFIGKSK